MEALFLQFDIDMKKNDHMFESAMSEFKIRACEITNLIDNGYVTENGDELMEEAVSDFLESVKKFFDEIIDKIVQLVKDTIEKIKIKAAQIEMNRKLAAMKNALAANKSIATNKVSMFDTKTYIKEYTEYVDTFVALIKTQLSKSYDTSEEWNNANAELKEKLKYLEDKYNFSDKEKYTIRVSLDKAYKMTEDEYKNYETTLNNLKKEFIAKQEALKAEAEKAEKAEKIAQYKKAAGSLAKSFAIIAAAIGVAVIPDVIKKVKANAAMYDFDLDDDDLDVEYFDKD